MGKSYIEPIPDSWFKEWGGARSLVATADKKEPGNAAATPICVSAFLSEGRAPDFISVEESTKMIAEILCRGQLLVLESTT